MAKLELIARQSRQPSGWLGEIVARVMALETRPANRMVLGALAAKPGESILEVGCGHGTTLARIAEAGAHVSGVDPSDVMLRVARRRLRRSIAVGRAELALGSSAKLPHADARFDAALAVHVLYFWRDPADDLREILRTLRPGGRLLLGYRPRDDRTKAELPASVYAMRTADEIEALLAAGGFTAVGSHEHVIAGVPFAVTEGRRPARA
jgi:SAM-dependent methyltransferase